MEKLQKAASAAQTYFVANPSHLEMRNNIEKYRRMQGVTDGDFQDREIENEKHWVRSGKGGIEKEKVVLYQQRILAMLQCSMPRNDRNNDNSSAPNNYFFIIN